ncbi:fibronectin type III domain-containing protein, partial [Patescibacteria group bacterium]|nr:fibronectin type III domain-containing protein [Patescibacteria group bacterium]
ATLPDAISDLEILHIYTTATSIKLSWTSPANANLGTGAYYDLRYKEKTQDCDLQTDWDNATKAATSSLPIPDSSVAQDQIAEITDLSKGVNYCFAIKTFNNAFYSDISNIAQTKTLASQTQLTTLQYEGGWNYAATMITQTLTPDKNPYYINRSACMSSNSVLTIEPGVVIKFGPWYEEGWYKYPVIFFATGQIKAKGTAKNPIVFTSIYDDTYAGDSNNDGNATLPAAGNWGGFQINSDNNIFDYVIIKYGGGDTRGLMTFYNNNNNIISNSVFSNNLRSIDFQAYSSTQPTIIETSDFSYTTSRSITTHRSANPIIRHNNIHHNYGGIDVADQSEPVINNNNIYNNTAYGVTINQWYNLTNPVNARFNWWGHESGPTYSTNPLGQGDKVTNNIDYSNWAVVKY